MDSVVDDIEVIELVLPVDALDALDALDLLDARAAPPVAAHLQWAAQVFHAARVQPARAVPTRSAAVHGAASQGAGGARTFYWWMLVGALLALVLA